MRKKLIAMIGAMVGLVVMATVASAGTVTVDYDAVNSTPTVAKYNVYTNGVSGTATGVGLQLVFNDDTVVDLANFTSSNVKFHDDVASLNPTAQINASKKMARLTAVALSGKVTYDETKPFMTISMPVKSNAQKSAIVATVTGNSGATLSFEQILPQSATVTGTEVKEYEGDPATYFKVTNAPLAGIAYWYADFAGTAKKLAANVPNTEGTANLGFVYTGTDAPSSVKIVCE